MRLAPDSVDTEQPLRTLGLDSLMAVEIRHRLQSRLGVSLPLAVLLEGPTVRQLSDRILPLLDQAADDSLATHPRTLGPEEAERLLEDLPSLSDDQVDALLRQVQGGKD